jgi:transcriptional regulator with XRE-family HTH domain
MTDFRLRRTAAVKSSKASTATRVAQVVGTNLKEIRRVQGHSLDTLAAASGVSRAMLGQIETGKSVPTITLLWKIAAALGVQVAQLITDPDVPLYTVTRRADRDKAEPSGIRKRSLTDGVGQAAYSLDEVYLAVGHRETYAPRRDGEITTAVVASGSIETTIGGEPAIQLGEGDGISFSAGLPHSFANNGPSIAILYLVMGFPRKRT